MTMTKKLLVAAALIPFIGSPALAQSACNVNAPYGGTVLIASEASPFQYVTAQGKQLMLSPQASGGTQLEPQEFEPLNCTGNVTQFQSVASIQGDALCIATDDVSGHALTLKSCNSSDVNQQWQFNIGSQTITSMGPNKLVMDNAGNGALVGSLPNGGQAQLFTVGPVSSFFIHHW
ncbi:MAG TPA: hypothetical protein VMK12_03390 [Anaeromyxobacteraceae bacterium]|nr:hypothetical protein [Anaeromyxobacteraceae bacterium]